MNYHPIIDLLKRIVIALPDYAGGGSGYILLANGTYTNITTSASMEIPINVSGTPIISYVCVSEPIESTGQFLGNISNNVSQISMNTPAIFNASSLNYNTSAGGTISYQTPTSIASVENGLYSDKIVLRRSQSDYQIRANDYNWYVWGIE